MARKEMTVETIIAKIEERFPYIALLEEIKSQKQDIRVRCTRCEKQCELIRSVYSLVKGKYAAECDRVEEAGHKFAKRISDKHPHIELVSGFVGRKEKTALFKCHECGCEWVDVPYNVLAKLLSEYKTMNYPILVECKNCHKKYFEMAWSLLKQKSGCRYCGKRPMSYADLISNKRRKLGISMPSKPRQ